MSSSVHDIATLLQRPALEAVPVALREEPEGGKSWTRRARRLQGQLISRWAGAYG